MTSDWIAKKLLLLHFLRFLSGTQTDLMISPKEKFLLAALMKQKHKTLIAQQKLNIQKKKNAKLSDKLSKQSNLSKSWTLTILRMMIKH